MSSQTVYFNNPADITKLQGQVGSTTGQVSTTQLNLTSGASISIKPSIYGETLVIVDPSDPTNSSKVRTYNVTASELVTDYDTLLAKLLAILVDFGGFNIYGYVQNLAGILQQLWVIDPVRTRKLNNMMYQTIFGKNDDTEGRMSSFPEACGSDLLGIRWREFNQAMDNLKLMKNRATQTNANGTGQVIADNCQHWLTFLTKVANMQQAPGQDIRPVVNSYNPCLQNRYILFGQDGVCFNFSWFAQHHYAQSTSNTFFNIDGNPFCLPTIADYNTITDVNEWNMLLSRLDYINNLAGQMYRDFEQAIQLGYRPMDHSIFGQNSYYYQLAPLLPRSSRNPWNTSRSQDNPGGAIVWGMDWSTGAAGSPTLGRLTPWVPLGSSTGTYIYNQMKAKFTTMQNTLLKITDRIVELYSLTLGQVLPYSYSGSSEPFIRSRYNSYASLIPDSPYKDLAGILPVYPDDRKLQAKEDWARVFKQTISSTFNPYEAFKYVQQQTDVGAETQAVNDSLSFINKMQKFDDPNHVDWSSQQYTGATGAQTIYNNFWGSRIRSRNDGLASSNFGDIRVASATSGVISTVYPHNLQVGDKLQFWGFGATGGIFRTSLPSFSTGNAFAFSSEPCFTGGDQVQIRDLASNFGSIKPATLSQTFYQTNPTTTALSSAADYVINSIGTGPLSISVTGAKLATWNVRRVKDITYDGSYYYVTLQSALSPAPLTGAAITIPTISFENSLLGKQVHLQNQTAITSAYTDYIYTVTAVTDEYNFTINQPVTFTDANIFIEYDWLTMEKKVVTWDRDFYTRIATYVWPRTFSDIQLQRLSTGTFYMARYASSTQRAQETQLTSTSATYPNVGVRYQFGSFDINRKYGWQANTIIHEQNGHGTYLMNNLFSNKSNIPEAAVICPNSSTFIEGQAASFEFFIPQLSREILTPQRKVTSINSNKIYYNSTGAGGIDNAFVVGDLVSCISIDGTDYSNLTTAGFSYPSGGKFTKVLKVASKGTDGGGSYITITNTDGSVHTLNNASFTDVYMVSELLRTLITSMTEYAMSTRYNYQIFLGDVALNYLGYPATLVESLYQSIAATEQRNTNLCCQHCFYGWGKLEIANQIDKYISDIKAALDPTFDYDKFFSLGHIKGFIDCLQIEGNLDKIRVDKHITDFTNYVIAGGDPTKYSLGQ